MVHKLRALTGVKPTGIIHLGNYLGAIRPAIQLQEKYENFYFVANFHAQTSQPSREELLKNTYHVAAAWMAFGLDPSRGAFFRQTDIPEVAELQWILSNYISLGDLFRAHAFKAAKERNEEGTLNLGTFAYPVLMAADILLYDADIVPVGQDQVQHLEIARAIAQRLNHYHGSILKEPKELLQKNLETIPGTDGRKMSKSYNNGIEPLEPFSKLKKQVMSIVTDSKGLEEPKDPDSCQVMAFYRLLAEPQEVQLMESKYRAGNFGYGHAKLELLNKIEQLFGAARERYEKLRSNEDHLEQIFFEGAQKARPFAQDVIKRVRKACGLCR